MRKDDMLSPKIGNNARVCTITTSTQHSAGSSSHDNNVKKKASKRHKDQEEEIILFAEDITVYVENSKEAHGINK